MTRRNSIAVFAAGVAFIGFVGGARAASAGLGPVARVVVTIDGLKQGSFKGDCLISLSKAVEPKKICATGIQFHVKAPRDPSTGQASGKRQYSPIVITKLIGANSVQEWEALITNETLTKVTIETWQSTPRGDEVVVSRTILSNANITEITQSLDPLQTPRTVAQGTESVSISFQKIEIDWLNPPVSTQDNWNQNN